MKKKLLLLFPALLTSCLVGCDKTHYTKVEEILEGSRVFEVNYDKVDWDGGDEFWAKNNDNWDGGCSAVTKKINEDGKDHRIVGRNMDLNLSEKAAYVVRTKANELGIKTLGLAYTFRDYAMNYQEVKEKGITDEFKTILPFMCDDVMNDQGLHIEVNMRHAEVDFSGFDQFSLEGTNPGKHRVHMFELPRYIAEKCKTVEEAKNLVNNELDIYSKKGYWDYCFMISDSNTEGTVQHSTLLEFSEIGVLGKFYNRLEPEFKRPGIDTVKAVNWIDEEDIDGIDWLRTGETGKEEHYGMNALAQTNFYINWWAYERQDIKSGEGRFITMQKLIPSVNSKADMYDLMRRISYSYFYNKYDTVDQYHFDPRSESVGEAQGMTYDFIFSEDYKDIIKYLLDAMIAPLGEMTRQERIDDGTFWESTFTEVVDVTERNIEVRFFENEGYRFKISFEGIEHLPTLETPKWDELAVGKITDIPLTKSI